MRRAEVVLAAACGVAGYVLASALVEVSVRAAWWREALDDESACSVCAESDSVYADTTRHAGWAEAMRFAHHAHASETSNGYPSANGVLGAGPDAVIVDGDWLAQVEADLAAARVARRQEPGMVAEAHRG